MRGGRREGAGRKAGVPNKATAEIKKLAQKHGPAAIARLAHLLANAESEQAQVGAAKELLDRAYGKSAPSPEETEAAAQLVVNLLRFRSDG